MIKFIHNALLFTLLLAVSGCSSNSWFYPNAQSNDPIEAALYLGLGLSMVEAPDKSCAGKSGEKQIACEQQVKDIKESISRAKKN